MKHLMFAIMAVLIFGMSVTLTIHDELAFAQTEQSQASEDRKDTSIDKKVATQGKIDASEDRKDTSIDKKVATQGKIDASEDRKDQRRANFDAIKVKLSEKFSSMSEDKKQKLQDKMDAMKEKRLLMKEKMDALKDRRTTMTIEEKESEIQKIREEQKAKRDARQNMTVEQRLAHIDELREKMQERTSVSPYNQIALGLNAEDIICSEEKELVIKVSNGMPICMKHNTAFILLEIGIVEYLE